jgi:predicted ester cyclase
MMDIAEMKKTAHRFHTELIQEHKLEVADQIVAPDAIIVTPFRSPENPRRGPEGAKEMSDMDYEAYPDGLIFNQDDSTTMVDGSWVSIRWSAHGMSKGPFGPCPPANKEIAFNGADFYRFNADGQIVEAWVYYDPLGVFQQFGVDLNLPE